MYAPFFGLKQEPFSIAPDPRYLFMSERHREALAHLLYGVKGGGGFVVLTGEIGAGKTTVCRCFLEQVPKRCNVAYIFNPKLTVTELLESVCHEFRIPLPEAGPLTVKQYVDALNAFLLAMHATGHDNLLIIDEAQNLSADVLEQLRLLTNLETNERKLLQIVLIGQPELRDMLARPELEQLAQRVIARFHLEALTETETAQYLRHRLSVAGLKTALPFDREARKRIHTLARGVPRRINLLADRALLGAYAAGRPRVDRAIVDKAAREVFDGPLLARVRRWRWRNPLLWAGGGVAVGAALFGVLTLAMDRQAAAPSRVPSGANATPAQASSAPSASSRAPLVTAGAASVASSTAASMPASAVAGIAPASSASSGASAPANALAFDALPKDEREAWRELAALWRLDLGGDAADPCAAAARQQVQCFKGGNTSLALIRTLDRPAILALHDEASGERTAYALLVGLSGQQAALRAGGTTQTVSLLTLARAWRGDYATFWRAPPGWRGEAPPASWLAAQLAALPGEPAASSTASSASESALRARVSAFQVAQGLRPDGLAGPMTLMQLNRASGIDEPHLAATAR